VGRPESYERELEAAISTMGFFSLIGRKKKGRPSKKERQGRNGQSAVRESALTEEQYRPRQQQQQAPSYTAPQSSSNMAAVATAIAAAPPPPPPPAAIESPDSSAEQKLLQQQQQESAQAGIDLTRSLVKKFIADIWNRGELDLIPEVCSPSLRFNGNAGFDRVGHDGLARMVGTIREALDDYHCEIHSMVVEHNKAFCRLRFTGKHTGNLLGYPPTGRVVGWMGATEFTCQNGKILKVWELGDIKTLEEQLIAIDDQPLVDDD